MINNRQGGRRRGRGGSGQRPPNNMQGGGGGGGGGNRQDNRQRGNAAQLLEKYKAMARDMQLAGDRVQTEYYLQFADHYHRVLSETRSRFENDNRRPQNDFSDEEEYQEEADAGQGERREYQQRERPEPRESREQQDYEPRERPAETYANEDEQPRGNGELRPRRQRNPRRERPEFNGEAGEERIALEVLPPAIGIEPAAEEEAPRRRTRRPRATEGGEDIAPAA